MQATFAQMSKFNIVGAVVSNGHDVALRWNAASPERVVVSYGFDNPSSLDQEFLRREHAAGRLMALGEIGAQNEAADQGQSLPEATIPESRGSV